jgi:hypothetical protein
MTETENATPESEAPAKPATPPAAAAATPTLPSQEEIAAWIDGAQVDSIGNLFQGLELARFDALVLQIRKEELLPQHWQVIAGLGPPEDGEFDRLPEVGELRLRYRDQALSRQRVDNLRVAWRELRGKRPVLWTVSDLVAAMRRIFQHDREVDFSHLLTAIRDVWQDLRLPHGREQLIVLWNCLALVRTKTKG